MKKIFFVLDRRGGCIEHKNKNNNRNFNIKYNTLEIICCVKNQRYNPNTLTTHRVSPHVCRMVYKNEKYQPNKKMCSYTNSSKLKVSPLNNHMNSMFLSITNAENYIAFDFHITEYVNYLGLQ